MTTLEFIERQTDDRSSSGKPFHSHSGSASTVLLAEDDSAVRDFMNSVLEQAGYRVMLAENGSRALEICQNHKSSIDVLITDVVMPETNGRELAEQVRKISPELKILFVSGYVDRGMDDDDSAFLEKPFTSESLLSAVAKLCATKPSR